MLLIKYYAFVQTEIGEWRVDTVPVEHTPSVNVHVSYYSLF